MGRHVSSQKRGLVADMVGKVDRVGRLIPDEVKYADQPNHAYWQEKLEIAKAMLVGLMGSYEYNEWVDSPEIPETATYKVHAEIYMDKVREITK